MDSFLAAKSCWSISVLFSAHCQKMFCFGLCAFKGRTGILTKALFMSVFNCWLTAFFSACWWKLLNYSFGWKEPTVKLNTSSSVPNNCKSKGSFVERLLSFRKPGKKEKYFFPSPTLIPPLRVDISTMLISMPCNKEILVSIRCFVSSHIISMKEEQSLKCWMFLCLKNLCQK